MGHSQVLSHIIDPETLCGDITSASQIQVLVVRGYLTCQISLLLVCSDDKSTKWLKRGLPAFLSSKMLFPGRATTEPSPSSTVLLLRVQRPREGQGLARGHTVWVLFDFSKAPVGCC